jgi:hypothetical protein
MILGFTGTRKGLTPQQRAALPSVLAALPERVLHGGAEGADTEFHNILRKIDSTVAIEVYPASLARQRTWVTLRAPEIQTFILHWELPLERNRLIAARCDHLLACPAEPTEQLRSGTWTTVRYARAAGKPITILNPDGSVTEERR